MKETILHITSEVSPFYKRGGLGDVLGALPRYLTDERYDNIVMSPYYKGHMSLPEGSYRKMTAHMQIFGIDYEYHAYTVIQEGVKYYFLNLADEEIYSSVEKNDKDGDQPYKGGVSFMYYLYFAKSVLDVIQSRNIEVDHVLCHDWQTAGIFAFQDDLKLLKLKYGFTTTYFIHNYEFQGNLFESSFDYLPIEVASAFEPIFDKYQSASMLALGIEYADHVATVSPTYAQQLMNNGLPHKGMKYLNSKKEIIPLLNGVDYDLWHPAKSPFLEENYSNESLFIKKKIKQRVLEDCFPKTAGEGSDMPLVLLMSRLTLQKGIQLFTGSNATKALDEMRKLLDTGIKIVIYGMPTDGLTGSTHKRLSYLQSRFEGSFYYEPDYKEEKAHRFLAAADILLAPSLFEPCGLVQIYAMAFGTVPVVRPVGGLKDTVIDHDKAPLESTGFYIKEHNTKSLRESIAHAVDIYQNRQAEWSEIVDRGMKQDYSWDRMKHQYFQFFSRIKNYTHATKYDFIVN